MTRFFLTSLLLAALSLTATDRALAQADGNSLRRAVEAAREKVYPALVNISVVSQDYVGGRIRRYPSAGSGVIVSPAGHVITNHHVAGDSARLKCTLPSGETIDAHIVTTDPLTDLCILKLELDERNDPTVPIPFATIGDSGELEVGDHVIAVGNPMTLSSSMTLGIVSNKERVFTDFTGSQIDEMEMGEGEVTGLYNQWIQHDALILNGNSGGPLINMKGDVVGINTRGGGGVGFAIPSPTVKHVLNQALTFGEVRRGWLGFSVLPVSKADMKKGALISYVVPGSPAERAGLQAGDVVLKFDAEAVNVRFFDEVPLLYQRIAEMETGRAVELTYLRGGERKTTQIEVDRLKKYLGEEHEFRAMGLTVRDLTEPMAISRKLADHHGVVVTGVRPGYPFEEARPRIERGAIVLDIDAKPITDLEEFKLCVKEASEKEKFSVVYRSGDEIKVTVVETDKDDPPRGGKELPKAWFGVKTQVLTAKVAKALGIEGQAGYRVTQVLPWTQAEEAGIKVGDLLVEMDDEKLDASRPQDAEDLRRAIEDMSIGDDIELKVLRDGEALDLSVELEESPASALDVKSARQEELEFAVRETTFLDRVSYKWPRDLEGVLITEATSGGWANIAGLRINDLLVSINGEPTPSVKRFEKVMEKAVETKPKVMKLFVHRGYRTHFVFIEPDWSKMEIVKK